MLNPNPVLKFNYCPGKIVKSGNILCFAFPIFILSQNKISNKSVSSITKAFSYNNILLYKKKYYTDNNIKRYTGTTTTTTICHTIE